MVTFMHQCVGRSDDARLVFLSDLCAPVVLYGVGPHLCKAFHFVLRGGKASAGNVEHMSYVRHADVHVCAMGAAARYLFMRYTIKHNDNPFPDPSTPEGWQAW
jgi:hypothetical protein